MGEVGGLARPSLLMGFNGQASQPRQASERLADCEGRLLRKCQDNNQISLIKTDPVMESRPTFSWGLDWEACRQ